MNQTHATHEVAENLFPHVSRPPATTNLAKARLRVYLLDVDTYTRTCTRARVRTCICNVRVTKRNIIIIVTRYIAFVWNEIENDKKFLINNWMST